MSQWHDVFSVDFEVKRKAKYLKQRNSGPKSLGGWKFLSVQYTSTLLSTERVTTPYVFRVSYVEVLNSNSISKVRGAGCAGKRKSGEAVQSTSGVTKT